MRKAVTCFLVLVVLLSSSSALVAQKTRVNIGRGKFEPAESPKSKSPKPGPRSETAIFKTAEAFTTGRGVWVHWQMEVETNNQGFYVYRMDTRAAEPVSEFILGGGFKSIEPTVYGEHYSFFDPSGNVDSQYIVETFGVTGGKTRSWTVGTQLVKSYPTVDGVAMFDKAPAINENARPSNTILDLPSDLKSEVITYQVAADPERHKQVIAQPGAKIAAKGSGIIRVTKAQLQAAGFDVNSDPALWQLYLEGVERAIIVGPNADYIEFFGRDLDTPESDIRTYYLIVGAEPGKRVRNATPRPNMGTLLSRRYKQTVVRKERFNYVNSVLNGDLENYWGRVVGVNLTTYNLLLTGVDLTPGDRVLRIAFQGYSITPHSVEITLNGNSLPPATSSGRVAFSKEYIIPASYLVEGNNALAMRSNGASGDLSLFDSVSVDYPRTYKAENNLLNFYTENYKRTILSGFSTSNVRVFDVTNELEPINLSGLESVETNGSFGPIIPAARGKVFFAVEANNFTSPVSVLPNNPEMLGVPTQGAQFLVITNASLMPQAQTWGNYRAGQGTATKVVDVEDVFDEFNYGTSSSQAIRDFLFYAKLNWQTPPQYVLLVGDSSYDPRNYSGGGNWNMVPAKIVNTLFLESCSDEALADFNNDGLAEIPIGRIASRDAAGVTNVFNKTVAWESSLNANSLDRGAAFAYDWPQGYDFQAMSGRIMSRLPESMPKTTISQTSPTAKTEVLNAFNEIDANNPANSGQYVVNYTGHGTTGAWRDQNFFWSGDVPNLTNATRPSLVTALTCLNGNFNIASGNESLAEVLTKASNGGAVAVWASTGETTPDVQEIMADRFFEQIGIGNLTRLGDLVADAKAQVAGGADVRLSWAILGDPMLKVR